MPKKRKLKHSDFLRDHVAVEQRAAQLRAEGLDVNTVIVNRNPDAKGFPVRCTGCDTVAMMATDPGTRVGLCPACARRLNVM